jgi:hypothetical protein
MINRCGFDKAGQLARTDARASLSAVGINGVLILLAALEDIRAAWQACTAPGNDSFNKQIERKIASKVGKTRPVREMGAAAPESPN